MRFTFPSAFVFNRRMRHLKPLALLLVSSYLSAQAPAGKLVAEGQSSPTLEKNLRALTDDIGGRVPGSPAMEWTAWTSGKRGRTR
jgi:hypothetical protein